MQTKLLVLAAAFAVLAVSAGVAQAEPGITAEVRGTLRYQKEGNIHFIAIPSEVRGRRETRVWLLRGEDKDRELDRTLERMEGKDVVAKGKLRQLPENTKHAVIPPLGLYLDNQFTVKPRGRSSAWVPMYASALPYLVGTPLALGGAGPDRYERLRPHRGCVAVQVAAPRSARQPTGPAPADSAGSVSSAGPALELGVRPSEEVAASTNE
jgi:hypothetical protein